MNPTNDDATKPFPKQDGAAASTGKSNTGADAVKPADATKKADAAQAADAVKPAEAPKAPITAKASDDTAKAVPAGATAADASADGTPKGEGAASKIAALKGEVTSRIAAVKKSTEDLKSSSRSSSRSGKDSSRTSHTPTTTVSTQGDKAKGTGRRVRLTLSRIDPWSVMKFSFLVAVAIGLATVIATAILWGIVDGIGLWDQLNEIATEFNDGKPLPFMEYFEFTKMISYATLVAFLNVIIITALGTLGAFLYNIVAALLGGIKVTFTDN